MYHYKIYLFKKKHLKETFENTNKKGNNKGSSKVLAGMG